MMNRRTVALFGVTLAWLTPLTRAMSAVVAKPKVEIKTNLGTMIVQLDPQKAPLTVENFLTYVREKFYDGTIFHRVIPGFMIQGGGFTPQMQEKPTHASIKNEAANGLKNALYTIAMARTSDPHSATSQFFINVADNAFLDQANARDRWGYCVFGRVVQGQEVAEKIAAVQTGRVGPFGDVPVKPVVIESIREL